MTQERALTLEEKVDALARDVANALSELETAIVRHQEDHHGCAAYLNDTARAVAVIRASHARPAEAPKRWYGVDRKGYVSDPRETASEVLQEVLVHWDRDFPGDAPHRAILATDADDARAQYAAMEAAPDLTPAAVGNGGNAASPFAIVTPPTPPADADDAGAALARALDQLLPHEGMWLSPAQVAAALRAIRQRDAWERDCIEAHVKLAAAERERDEAREVVESLKRVIKADDKDRQRDIARAYAAEARARELRALCGEAADVMLKCPSLPHLTECEPVRVRLRAAAQPASEGRADA